MANWDSQPKAARVECPGCYRPTFVAPSGDTFDHPVGPAGPDGHDAPYCDQSGRDWYTGVRTREMPVWGHCRPGCEISHLLGRRLPDSVEWLRRMGPEAYHHIRLPKDTPLLRGTEIPDVMGWLKFVIRQLVPVCGSTTDAYRAAMRLIETQAWYREYQKGIWQFASRLADAL